MKLVNRGSSHLFFIDKYSFPFIELGQQSGFRPAVPCSFTLRVIIPIHESIPEPLLEDICRHGNRFARRQIDILCVRRSGSS